MIKKCYVVVSTIHDKPYVHSPPMASFREAQTCVDDLQPKTKSPIHFVGELTIFPAIEMKDLPTDLEDELLTLEEFKEGVDTSAFTNWDGFGYYATETHESNIQVDIRNIEAPRPELTHVMWYNK